MLPLHCKVRFAAKVSGFSNTRFKTLSPWGEVFFWGSPWAVCSVCTLPRAASHSRPLRPLLGLATLAHALAALGDLSSCRHRARGGQSCSRTRSATEPQRSAPAQRSHTIAAPAALHSAVSRAAFLPSIPRAALRASPICGRALRRPPPPPGLLSVPPAPCPPPMPPSFRPHFGRLGLLRSSHLRGGAPLWPLPRTCAAAALPPTPAMPWPLPLAAAVLLQYCGCE